MAAGRPVAARYSSASAPRPLIEVRYKRDKLRFGSERIEFESTNQWIAVMLCVAAMLRPTKPWKVGYNCEGDVG